jgi:hypothetical protein
VSSSFLNFDNTDPELWKWVVAGIVGELERWKADFTLNLLYGKKELE